MMGTEFDDVIKDIKESKKTDCSKCEYNKTHGTICAICMENGGLKQFALKTGN